MHLAKTDLLDGVDQIALAQARALIMTVRDKLDMTQSECDSCGLKKHNDWDAVQLNERLKGMTTKIDKILKDVKRRDA